MRMSIALAILSSLLVPATGMADVADYIGKPIVAVRVESEGRSGSDERLLEVIQTRVGSPLSMVAVRETVAHLFSLGRFEDVRVHADATSGGVELLYELVPVHPLSRIRFSGPLTAPGIDQGSLQRTLEERFGATPRVGRAADMVRLVEDQLRDRGYLRARVTSRLDVEHAPERASLVLVIDPGPRTRIGTVDVVAPPGISTRQLLDRLDIESGAPYERQVLNARVEEFLADQRRNGYYGARLDVAPRLADEDRVAHLTVTSLPGPRVRVVFRGDPLPADRRDDLVPLAREGSADEDLLEDSRNRVEEYLRAQGYRDAVAPYSREEANGELIITFTVDRGPQYRVADVVISGNATLPLAEFEPALRLRAGQPFEAARLDADVAMIEELYRRLGFAAVSVRSGVDPVPGEADPSQVPVIVRVVIAENARTIVSSVSVQGNQSIPEATLLNDVVLRPGSPFFVTQLAVDRDALQVHYNNLGYLTATVETSPGLSADGTRADIVFTVREGPQILVDHVLIVGNVRTRTEVIERELQIREGDPLGLAAINESQRRLASLGLFRRTRIAQLGHGAETKRDLLITLEEAPPTSVGYGGGLEVEPGIGRTEEENSVASERLEFWPRAFFEVTRRNLFGKNRSVNLFTRIGLRPDSPSVPENQGADASEGGFGFSEYRVQGTFREPRVLGTFADASLTGTAEQQKRSSFNFARRAFAAEAGRRIARRLSLSGNYQIQRTELFDEQIDPEDKLLIDRLFPQVRLSSFSLSAIRDTRDDPLDPGSGEYTSANGQIAGRRIGSEVGFVKSYLTAQLFRTLPRTNQIVFAANARLGLAAGFPRRILQIDVNGQPVAQVVKDLPASERFFAGGDTTVRGFALDQLGTAETIDKDGFPIGGNAVVILNAELRVPIRGGLGVVGFFDSGNVFARTVDIDLGRLRSAAGFGVRYQSPVGPIRVDLGFKMNRRDIVPGRPERLTALHISLGQAF
jgi:outer membrane protein insertion porin family